MKRLLLIAVALGDFSLPAAGRVPAGDSVIGSGTARFITPDLAGLTVPFSIDIRSGPSGEDPVGGLQLFLGFDDPTCMAIRSGGGQYGRGGDQPPQSVQRSARPGPHRWRHVRSAPFWLSPGGSAGDSRTSPRARSPR